MRTPGYVITRLSSRAADEIQRNIIERNKRNVFSRRYHVKDDKEAIATWRLDFNRIRRIIDVRSATPL